MPPIRFERYNTLNLMKRALLALPFTIAGICASAQVVVQVLAPTSIATDFDNTYAVNAGTNNWAVPDLTDPANAVQAMAALVDDGTAPDSLGCGALVNAADLAGKIAVVYRGTCGFGVKALNAQNAGAIAVLIISNNDDLNFNMLGGTEGLSVTIPVVMIAQSSGPVIHDALVAGELELFIGNNFGAFPFNLSVGPRDVLVPSSASLPEVLAANASEFSVLLGGWIHNNGSSAQSTARLRAQVIQGTVLYDEVSGPQSIPSGDSVFVSIGTFDQPAYSGRYEIIYSVGSDEVDGFPGDDIRTLSLSFGDVFSYVPTDETTGIPISDTHVVPADNVEGWSSCVTFTDPNGGRVSVTGLHFSATTPTDQAAPNDSTLVDAFFEAEAYIWSDPITSPFTTPSATGLSAIASADYTFTSDLQGEHVFIPFDAPIQLENGERYLFCIKSFNGLARHGWNASLDYEQNFQEIGDPVSMILNSTWFNGFTALNGAPSIGVEMVDDTNIGIRENNAVEVTPFPNPAQSILRIPLTGLSGTAVLRILDARGTTVSEQRVALGGDHTLSVDVSGISNGTYLFHMDFENGQRSDFRVVVTK
ncbi:MAG: hypothetical protein KDB84_12530 [Flavobacteriales bacterium]|nr:hypothetical protein [Flavobacteriales bacterium]